jgi:hypothetical protein
MFVRHLLIGVMTLATQPYPQVPSEHLHSSRPLLNNVPLSDEISIDVIELSRGVGSQPPMLVVHVWGQPVRSGGTNPHPRLLSEMAIQVWLLRADGTSMAQRPKMPTIGDRAGVVIDTTSFFFDDAPRQDVTGVVVSVNGKLFVREIKATSTPWRETIMLARQLLIAVMALLVSRVVVQAQGLTLPNCLAAVQGDVTLRSEVGCQSKTGTTFEPEHSSIGTVPKLRLALRSERIEVPIRATEHDGSQQTKKASGPLWHAAVWGVVGGVAGFFAGVFIGDRLDAPEGMQGAIIFSVSGAALGAFILAKVGP